MELQQQVQRMLSHSLRKVSALLLTGTSTSSTLRPSMSHGSQRALVLMANLETRITGVHTMGTDLPSSMTTRASTALPRHLKSELVGNDRDG